MMKMKIMVLVIKGLKFMIAVRMLIDVKMAKMTKMTKMTKMAKMTKMIMMTKMTKMIKMTKMTKTMSLKGDSYLCLAAWAESEPGYRGIPFLVSQLPSQ